MAYIIGNACKRTNPLNSWPLRAAKRLTAEQALAHPWLASLHDPTDEPSCLQVCRFAKAVLLSSAACWHKLQRAGWSTGLLVS